MGHPKAPVNLEVIIIGAGISGLLMGILLEQIGIQYHIYERASEMKPLGSAIALGAHIFPVLEQLGIFEDLLSISKAFGTIHFSEGSGKSIGQITREQLKEKFGYDDLTFVRPDFHKILQERIPVEKISFKKKITNIEEKNNKVTIHCADNTSYTGDILIGADGAYSGVRQSLYKQLNHKGLLPECDLEDFRIGYTVSVGVANVDPKKYAILQEKSTKFCQIVFNGDSNCYVVPQSNNRISWGLGTQLSREASDNIRNTDWTMDSSEESLKPFRDSVCPFGGTMGEIFDATPKEVISKVYVEEKVFKTWYHGRIVLIGDACHKLHPSGGQGATNAMQDAVVLANALFFMKDNSNETIHRAFEKYYEERKPLAEAAFKMSAESAMILGGQSFFEKLIRKVILNYIPHQVYDFLVDRMVEYRPQVAWLPVIENRGKNRVKPQTYETYDEFINSRPIVL